MAKTIKKFLKSFTLIELIIVIAIIAVLGTTAFLLLTQWMSKGRDATKISTIRTIKTALDINYTARGDYPIPQDAVEHTASNGTKLYQGYVGGNMVAELQRTPIDPATKKPYIYSYMKPTGSVGYYQIGTTLENTVGYEGYNLAKADIVQTAKIIGNYEFDPSLPSLIIVGGNETTKGIYDPSNCYVLDGGKNTVDGAQCQPKKDMPLKDYDNGLVGYWDMESLTDDGKLMDISGNGNHGVFSGQILPISTGAYMGSGLYFSGKSLIYTNNDIKYYGSDSVTVTLLLRNINIGNSWNMIIESSKDANVNTGSFYLVDNYISICGVGTRTTVAMTKLDVYFSGSTMNGTVKCLMNNTIENDFKILSYVFDYSNPNNNQIYINGIKQNTFNHYRHNLIGSLDYIVNKHIFDYPLYIGLRNPYYNNGFVGDIDEVKIYNRALSEAEILQQAKIAGF